MKPVPQTKRAYLMSEGTGTITRHRYVETRRVVLPTPDGEAWEFVFECETSGNRRRWGTMDIQEIDVGN